MTEFVLHPNGTTSHEDELLREGWVRQFTANEPRLSEAIELYESMGYDVHVEQEDGAGRACNVCFGEASEQFKVIYIRPKANAEDKLEDLF